MNRIGTLPQRVRSYDPLMILLLMLGIVLLLSNMTGVRFSCWRLVPTRLRIQPDSAEHGKLQNQSEMRIPDKGYDLHIKRSKAA